MEVEEWCKVLYVITAVQRIKQRNTINASVQVSTIYKAGELQQRQRHPSDLSKIK